MKVEQFVMAYKVEQDRIRAMLPEGFMSLRPVLRINTEICGQGKGRRIYMEVNTPVEAFDKRGWLNIDNWETPQTVISYQRKGNAVTFYAPFLEITYISVGIEGGCPAEKDNDGCFFIRDKTEFVSAEQINQKREFCDCRFQWNLAGGTAHGSSSGGKSMAAVLEEVKKQYEKTELSASSAAAIECERILGAYMLEFER